MSAAPEGPAVDSSEGVSTAARIVALSICCEYDEFPGIVAAFREEKLYPQLRNLGMDIRECHGARASIQYDLEHVSSPDVIFIMGAGHGRNNRFLGDQGEPVFQVGCYSPEHVNGRIVHLNSCWTALKLGPDFVKNGCLAFFGYNEQFFIPGTAGFDEALECDGEIDLAFAEGLDAEAVYQRVMAKYDEVMEQLARQGEYGAIEYLRDNRDALCAPSVGSQWGQTTARLNTA